MAQEIQVKSYYSSVYDKGFISTNVCCKLGMEFFLSQLLLKGDLKKVVYSKEDIAFRRRIETLGEGTVKDQTYNYITLDLPFAVYSQTGGLEEDDRGATQNAGQIVLGRYNPDYGLKVKAAAVKTKYSATIFFGRREDVNVASQLLYWEQTPKFPVYYIVEHDYYGHIMSIPVFMTLESFDSNVEYQEKEWLDKSKIFPLKCEFTVRSYQTLIENVDNIMPLPIRFSGLYGYNEGNEIVLTQRSILIWADQKWTISEDEGLSETIEPDDPNIKIEEIKTLPSVAQAARDKEDVGMINYGKGTDFEKTAEVVKMAVEGYFQDDRDCVLDEFYQINEKTTETEIMIGWKIKEADIPYFKEMHIYIPGVITDIIKNPNEIEYQIRGVYPGSKYDCTLVIISKNNTKLTYKLTLKTKGEPVLGRKLSDNLVGKTFTFTGQ